jgi:hypothetical protein
VSWIFSEESGRYFDGGCIVIHGVIKDGEIVPLDPIPEDWSDGRQVVIEAAGAPATDERAEIDRWHADLAALGPAQYEPGEREAIDQLMADADREAKESMKRSWARFDDALPPGHESS